MKRFDAEYVLGLTLGTAMLLLSLVCLYAAIAYLSFIYLVLFVCCNYLAYMVLNEVVYFKAIYTRVRSWFLRVRRKGRKDVG